jgi:hypothetical protein
MPAPFHYVLPITLGIAALLIIVAISYRQAIHAYPNFVRRTCRVAPARTSTRPRGHAAA